MQQLFILFSLSLSLSLSFSLFLSPFCSWLSFCTHLHAAAWFSGELLSLLFWQLHFFLFLSLFLFLFSIFVVDGADGADRFSQRESKFERHAQILERFLKRFFAGGCFAGWVVCGEANELVKMAVEADASRGWNRQRWLARFGNRGGVQGRPPTGGGGATAVTSWPISIYLLLWAPPLSRVKQVNSATSD